MFLRLNMIPRQWEFNCSHFQKRRSGKIFSSFWFKTNWCSYFLLRLAICFYLDFWYCHVMIVDLIPDRDWQMDNLHDILDTLPPIESPGKCPALQCFRLNSELHAVNMAQPIQNSFKTLFGEIIISGRPRNKPVGVDLLQEGWSRSFVIDKLFVRL